MPSISFVGATSNKSSSGDNSNTSFTISKPSGVASGDFMVAMLSFYGGSSTSQRTVTAPAGWTKVGEEYITSGGNPHQLCVMTRTAGSSEPGSWNGSVSTNAYVWVTASVAYRNVVGLATSGTSEAGSSRNYSTATVNNATPTNWRLTMASYTASNLNWEIDSSESTEREIDDRSSNEQDVQVGVWDSSGTISTGNTSRSITRDSNWSTSASWIGILDANDVTLDGTMSVSLPAPLAMTASAELGYSGTLDAGLPLPTMEASGVASPPEGPLDVTITPTMSVDAAHHTSGSLDALIVPTMEVGGETRQFGIRVIVPEAETRVIVPRFSEVS